MIIMQTPHAFNHQSKPEMLLKQLSAAHPSLKRQVAGRLTKRQGTVLCLLEIQKLFFLRLVLFRRNSADIKQLFIL